jgi:carbon storage regulator
MLVLTRKEAETIHIGDDVIVKVIKTGNSSIKLGIEAPGHVRILRGEVADAAARLTAPPTSKPSGQLRQAGFSRTGAPDSVRGEAL